MVKTSKTKQQIKRRPGLKQKESLQYNTITILSYRKTTFTENGKIEMDDGLEVHK